MTTLYITRGLPGSGKTHMRETYEMKMPGLVGLSRDDLRMAIWHGRERMEQADESYLTDLHHSLVGRHLASGKSVFVDDTNYRDKTCREWRAIAVRNDAEFKIIDLRDVPLDTCLAQVQLRVQRGGHHVNTEYIVEAYARHIAGRNLSTPLADEVIFPPPRQYSPDLALTEAYVFDIDGTLALNTHRGPYDTSKYETDEPNKPVRQVAWILEGLGMELVFTSGRSEDFRDVTQAWLDTQGLDGPLIMRKSGDTRRDDIVKLELFWQEVAPKYNVLAAFDDRQRVVDAWRSIGLTCFQVAPGNF